MLWDIYSKINFFLNLQAFKYPTLHQSFFKTSYFFVLIISEASFAFRQVEVPDTKMIIKLENCLKTGAKHIHKQTIVPTKKKRETI